MKPTKLPKRKISIVQSRNLIAEALNDIASEATGPRKWRWRALLAVNIIAFTLLVAFSNQVDLVRLAVLAGILSLVYFLKCASHPGRDVQRWAIEEQKHETIKLLKGSNTEELEKMLSYHLEQGNIEQADQISQRLLAMIDGHTSTEAAGTVEAPATLKVNGASKLPDWMQNEQTEGTNSQSENLPDWMKQ